MNFHLKKLTALLLAALLIVSVFPAAALAAPNESTNETPFGYIPMIHHGGRALTNQYLSDPSAASNTRATLPSSYDSRNYGYITPVRNQNPYGTCWTFGTMASVEAYMIKHGIISGDTGAAATTAMDLSESHLAWFNYTNAYDKLGMLTGDSSKPVGDTFLDLGGNGAMSTYTLMRWEGPAS
ncbi:MAG: hypothetical protein J5878_00960, partial [Oscillospiraceae bacterium]|nr:hypothetical protein [Oscillospiraceae bacterium]